LRLYSHAVHVLIFLVDQLTVPNSKPAVSPPLCVDSLRQPGEFQRHKCCTSSSIL